MIRVNRPTKTFLTIAGTLLISVLAACNNAPTPPENPTAAPVISVPNITDARRLSDGASKLMEAMKWPTKSFRFTFQGKEKIGGNRAPDDNKAPQVGSIALQADISPQEIDLAETRGGATRTTKAKKGDEMGWAMANLTMLGVMTSPNLVIALGSSVTQPPTTDLVGTESTDKFTFDTSTATPSQRRGVQAARMVLTTLRECKGTAWIAKDSGVLVKFNVDADYQDKNQHTWNEHYEGEVTPK